MSFSTFCFIIVWNLAPKLYIKLEPRILVHHRKRYVEEEKGESACWLHLANIVEDFL